MEIEKIIQSFRDVSDGKKEKFNAVKIMNGKNDFLEIDKKNIDFKKINIFFSIQKINTKLYERPDHPENSDMGFRH